MLVDAWLARAAAARPLRVAVQTPRGSCTYAELLAAARAAAVELSRRGARAGDRVALELPAGIAFAQALHACLLLGAVAVPVDPRLGAKERDRIRAGAAVRVEEPLPGGGEKEPARDGGDSRTVATERHDLAAVAAVIHTSGTTAAPRPVELTYGNFLWSALGSSVALGADPAERWLCALPLSHVGGLSILLRSAIHATTAVVHDGFDTDRVLRALREEKVTVVSLVATTLQRLLDAGLRDPAALRVALTGGGPVGGELVARAHAAGVPVALTYGLTEACSQVATSPCATLAAAPANAGPPLFCTRLRIAGDGEILVGGPTVARSAQTEDGWLHTGDLGRVDESGGLLVTGRKADTIITGGENVAPTEVEAVLEAHPEVLEAAVVGRPDGRWGEAVVAWVLPRPGADLRGEELAAHCSRALAAYKVPKDYVIAEGPLPRTTSGKLLRRELK
jgi:O-succinylbenzoic acid--CoA ligase